MDSLIELSIPNSAPIGFGEHPKVRRELEKYRRNTRDPKKHRAVGQRIMEWMEDEGIPVQELADSRHPEVYIIPRNTQRTVVECLGGERAVFHRMELPFSSTDFYVDIDNVDLFNVFATNPFSRLVLISQLGYLVPPRPDNLSAEENMVYTVPQFHHSRWDHSLLVAILMEIVLARNNFSQQQRATQVLAAACHDVAMPAGGDSIQRVDPSMLDEENNFAWVLDHYGLTEKWSKRYDFDIVLAEQMIRNKGVFGQLLDVLDKLSYTALDCYQVGRVRTGKIRDLCVEHPLVMDVWQDIKFTADGSEFFFSSPKRLFYFLLLRAYEFQEFLFNPYSRTLDFFLKSLVQPLYDSGVITKEQLLTKNDEWLVYVLNKHYPGKVRVIIEPEELSFQRFETEQKQQAFVGQLGDRLSHAEYVGGIKTGLDWLVRYWGRTKPLREAISQDKVDLLEGIARSTIGYYVYYYNETA